MENFDYFNWILLPLLIFLARLCDVTLATMRHIFISRGFKKIVPLIGFFEVMIWLAAITQIVNNLNNIACYIAWGTGFATGTYVGMLIEERLALGLQIVRIITNQNCDTLIESLKETQQGLTVIPGQGAIGPVKILFTIVKRGNLENVVQLIRRHNPTAFYSVEDIRDVSQGVFSPAPGISIVRRMFPGGKSK